MKSPAKRLDEQIVESFMVAATFGATSTTDQVLSGVALSGKRVLVTGVSAGLGVETARTLAAHGAQVIGAARDLAKAERATAQVRADAATSGRLELVELDLASLASVRLHLERDRDGTDLLREVGRAAGMNRQASAVTDIRRIKPRVTIGAGQRLKDC
jgi:NADP-dependent 3-hydroxy acid dehydrogenase YdfG